MSEAGEALVHKQDLYVRLKQWVSLSLLFLLYNSVFFVFELSLMSCHKGRIMFENNLRVKTFYYVRIVCMFVRMNASVSQFLFIQLISIALQPGHSYHWSHDDAGQYWLSSARVSENSHTKKQRLQFQLVEWVPFCRFDQFPSKYVLPRKVPSLNSQQKAFQSKLQHSISLHLVDIA